MVVEGGCGGGSSLGWKLWWRKLVRVVESWLEEREKLRENNYEVYDFLWSFCEMFS
jgi:hypothetical protein